jgi:uncharacterized membrane protein YjfL (UPF0719 family)
MAIQGLLQPALTTGLALGMFCVAKWLHNALTPYGVNLELKSGNLAAAVSLSGYLLGVLIVMVGAFLGPSNGFRADLLGFAGYALLGILLLNGARWINDKLFLCHFCNTAEIVRDRNVGTGAVEFGSYVATALVIAGAVHGEGGGLHTALVFAALGQLALALGIWLYDMLTPLKLLEEIEADNVPAGIALGGMMIALGILMMRGTQGNFIDWGFNLAHFGVDAAAGLLLFPLVRLLSDRVLVPGLDLDQAVLRQRNIAAAAVEAIVAVSIAVLLYFMLDFGVLLGGQP